MAVNTHQDFEFIFIKAFEQYVGEKTPPSSREGEGTEGIQK
jgi:hypothetical protein